MENELEENKKYNVKNLIMFEYTEVNCKISILQQEKQQKEFDHISINYENCEYRIMSVNSMEIEDDTFFLKGSYDFGRDIVSRLVTIDLGRLWEKLLQIPETEGEKIFTIVHNMEEANKYLITPSVDGGDIVDFNFNDEPSEEDIDKMISLVDLSTFCKIIQCRLKIENNNAFSITDKKPTMEDIGKITNKWAKKYLVDWAKAKYKFYKIFGDKLTLEKEIEHIPTDNEAKILKDTLITNFPLYAPIFNNISTTIIRDNKMIKEQYPSIFNNYKDVDKMTFTKFMSLYNNKDINNEISKLYQATGKTNITISINPIDYLTVSINKANWKSCHNFFDGCYGTAGLSLMHDKTSLVGFSSIGEIEYKDYYKSFKWNNKVWREMIYVSTENSAMVFSRQYPFTDERFSRELRKLMEDAYSNYFNTSNLWKVVRNKRDFIDIDNETNLLYNDVANDFSFIAIKNKYDNNKNFVNCIIGETIKCLNSDCYIEGGNYTIW